MKKNTNTHNKIIRYNTVTPDKKKDRAQTFQNKMDNKSLLKCSNITIKVSTFEDPDLPDSSLFLNSDDK